MSDDRELIKFQLRHQLGKIISNLAFCLLAVGIADDRLARSPITTHVRTDDSEARGDQLRCDLCQVAEVRDARGSRELQARRQRIVRADAHPRGRPSHRQILNMVTSSRRIVDHLRPNVLSIVSKASAAGNTETASDAVEALPSPDLIMKSAVIETGCGLSHSRAQRLRSFLTLLRNHDLRRRDGRGRFA